MRTLAVMYRNIAYTCSSLYAAGRTLALVYMLRVADLFQLIAIFIPSLTIDYLI